MIGGHGSRCTRPIAGRCGAWLDSHLAAPTAAARYIRPGYGRLRPYKCGYCGWFHLTHQDKRAVYY